MNAGTADQKKCLASSLIVRYSLSSLIVVFSVSVTAQESYSPYVGQGYPTAVYWGDTHLHTSLSRDAYIYGTRIGPAEAYRLARGEAVTSDNGMSVRLRRPLDFLVVADHAEFVGMMAAVENHDPLLLRTQAGQRLLRRSQEIAQKQPSSGKIEFLWDLARSMSDNDVDVAFTRSIWHQITGTADHYNEPGRFTAFIGYEWTSSRNLHRVVVFRDGAHKANQVLPFSRLDSEDPDALWTYLTSYEQQAGGEVLAIPHNGNLSDGAMFSLQEFSGEALARSYAERRSRWEPLYEVTQTKGTTETHPFLSPTDEFADYEIWDGEVDNKQDAKRNGKHGDMARLGGEYARSAFKRGLELQAQLGENPFKFGLVGGTDIHNSLPAAEENNFWGKFPLTGPGPDRATGTLNINMSFARYHAYARTFPQQWWSFVYEYPSWRLSSSGYAAVWATENTREALFAAMRRKETYATTGPRMTVRFFGGWDYAPEDAFKPDLALIGYRKGVPMGGDLSSAPEGKAPRFLICAVKDPDGANLDRVQVIKGWRNVKGELHERIYNVALSDGRKEGPDGKAPQVGSTVDVSNATYKNTIGDPELAVVWKDPDFEPSELAFYYVRVIEIPTPRWTAYDAKFFGIKDIPPEVPMITQERAYTSPIWYTPNQSSTAAVKR